MTVDLHVLLKPCCPDSDDPDLHRLLELFATASGATAAQLQITLDDSGEQHTYSSGEVRGQAITLGIDVPGPFTATLCLDSCSTPADDVKAQPGNPSRSEDREGVPAGPLARLAAYALEQTLLAQQLRRQAVMLRSALDTTSSGVLLFAAGGDIIFANPPADRLLSRQTEDGLVVREKGGESRPLLALLCSLVDRVAQSEDQRASFRGNMALSDGSALTCEVIKLLLPGLDRESFVLAILQSGDDTDSRDLAAFASRFGLSKREREVIRLMADGLSTQAVAQQMGISQHTVRDHLKSMYRKTETTCRKELLQSLARASFVSL